MRCPKCHNNVPEGDTFCGKCGLKLPEYPFICPKCCKGYKDKRQFCGECGTPLVNMYTGKSQKFTTKERVTRIIVWIISMSIAILFSYWIIKTALFS